MLAYLIVGVVGASGASGILVDHGGGLRLTAIAEIRAEEFGADAFMLSRNPPATCTLPSSATVTVEPVAPEAKDWRLIIARGHKTRAVLPQPLSGVRGAHWGVFPLLACDAAIERVYFAHPLVGFVAAFDAEGAELWRQPLPHFVRSLPPGEVDIKAARVQSGNAHIVGALSASGAYLLVEYRQGREGNFHTVYHRSGAFVGTVGPHSAILKAPADLEWRLLEWDEGKNWQLPSRESRLEVVGGRLDSIFAHLRAWLVPPKGSTAYTFRSCLSADPEELRSILGPEFDLDAAKTSQAVLAQLTMTWFRDFAKTSGLMPLLRDFRDDSLTWRVEFDRALVRANIDTSIISKLNELSGTKNAGGPESTSAPTATPAPRLPPRRAPLGRR